MSGQLSSAPWQNFKLLNDNYSIEKYIDKPDDDLHTFVYHTYMACKNTKKNSGINEEIDYNRKLFLSKHGKNYIGTDDDDTYEDSDSPAGIRRMITRGAMRKIQKMTAILMDSRASVIIKPSVQGEQNPEMQQKLAEFGGVKGLQELYERLFNDWWDRNQMDKVNYKAIFASIREGCAILNTYWDAERNFGDGDVVVSLNDPLSFIPEPGCTEVDQCQYVFFDRLIDPRRGEEEYGEEFVEENLSVFEDIDSVETEEKKKRSGEDFGDINVVDSVWKDKTKIYYYEANGMELDKADIKKAKKAVDAGETTFEQLGIVEEAVYPFGRIISFTDKGIYRDKPNDKPFSPFELFVPLPEPFDIFGYSMATVIAPFQEAVDKIIQMIMDNFERVGNTWVFIKEGALADGNDNIPADLAGQVIKIKDKADMRDIMHVVAGHVIAPDAWPILQMLDENMDDATSVNDAAEGNKPGGMQSGRAFLALQEATNRLLRVIAKFYEKILQKVAIKVVYLMHENYDSGRKYSYMVSGDPIFTRVPLTLREIDLAIDVFVEPGSIVPKNEAAEADKAATLFEMGIIDGKTLLKMWAMPEVDQTIASMYQGMMQAAAKKVQQAQGNPQAMQALQMEIPPDVMQTLMRDMQQEQGKVQGQTGPGAAGPT